jgi:flagellar export protein FliJ
MPGLLQQSCHGRSLFFIRPQVPAAPAEEVQAGSSAGGIMPDFRFALQRLLDLRHRSEDEARCQLASRQREVSCHQTLLAQLQQACSEARPEAVPAAGQPVNPGLLLNNDLHLTRLRTLTVAQQTSVDHLHSQEQADRAELLTKARSRQVLERLRERRYELHVADQAHRETKQLDEAATMAFAANRRTSIASETA